jgi:hypothetical protein
MDNRSLPKPFALYILLLLLLALGAGGIYGGFLLTDDPSGRLLQMPLNALQGSPFQDFLIPGIILLLFNGFLPLLIAYGLIVQPDWKWPERLNIYPNRHWAWTFSLYCGIILGIWIGVQLLLLGPPHSPLQGIFALWGTVTVVFTMWPGVMRYFER